VWIEPREIEQEVILWRGVVEVIGDSPPSGDLPSHKAFRNLDDLLEFLAGRLEELGIPAEQLQRQKP
jgi:hypothetical protein